jgi:hypothetical protein
MIKMSFGSNVSLLLIIMFMSGSFKSGVEGGLYKKRRVLMTVRNDLKTALTLSCYSSEDNLGTQILQTNQTLNFNFKPNISGSTKFVCNFVWVDNKINVIHNNYPIYAYNRDAETCGHRCLLGINQMNVTQYDAQSRLVQTFPW